jgi:hypothetical protein
MPNSLYAATALSNQNFLPRCVPGPYGARVEIDRSDTFEPATATVANAAGDPGKPVKAGNTTGFRIMANAGVKAALVPR